MQSLLLCSSRVDHNINFVLYDPQQSYGMGNENCGCSISCLLVRLFNSGMSQNVVNGLLEVSLSISIIGICYRLRRQTHVTCGQCGWGGVCYHTQVQCLKAHSSHIIKFLCANFSVMNFERKLSFNVKWMFLVVI